MRPGEEARALPTSLRPDAGGTAPVLPPGWRLEVFDTLPSTSDWLIQQAEQGAPEGLAVLAGRQTAGRGRNGRQWASPQGNLYLSVLLRPAGTAREAGQWALLAGVALFEAAVALDDGPQGRLAWLVLGIGVNLAAAPALPDRPTAMLGGGEAPEAFAARLLARLDHWCRVQAAQGFAPVRAAWEAAGPRRGTALTVRLGEGSIAGRYAALAEDGSLLLETEQGLRRITAGEVAAMEAR